MLILSQSYLEHERHMVKARLNTVKEKLKYRKMKERVIYLNIDEFEAL